MTTTASGVASVCRNEKAANVFQEYAQERKRTEGVNVITDSLDVSSRNPRPSSRHAPGASAKQRAARTAPSWLMQWPGKGEGRRGRRRKERGSGSKKSNLGQAKRALGRRTERRTEPSLHLEQPPPSDVNDAQLATTSKISFSSTAHMIRAKSTALSKMPGGSLRHTPSPPPHQFANLVKHAFGTWNVKPVPKE